MNIQRKRMGVAPAIDLTAGQRRTVLVLLNRYLPGTTVWAYGSRVKWTSHPASDLDLVVFAKPEQAARVTELREAFDESNLPFRVDLFVWDDVPESFRKRIETEHVTLAKREERNRTVSNDWRTVTLGACATPVADKVAPADSGDLPYIGLEHIGQGTLSLNGIGSARDVESTKTAFCAGDILFGKLRPYFRKVVRPRFDGICSTDIWVFRPKEDVDAGFLFYLLASSELVRFASQGAEGTRMPRAKWEPASRFSVRLPPVSEQRAIAQILGALDDKIELNRRMATTLEDSLRALFQSWFVDFDPVRGKMGDRKARLPEPLLSLFPHQLAAPSAGEVPEGWSVRSLDEIAHFQNGLALQRHRPLDGDGRLPVLKIAQLRSEVLDGNEYASSNIPSDYVVEDGDVVFSWSGSLMAKIWCGGRAALNQHLFKVTSDRYGGWFILGWLQQHMQEFQAIASDKATTMGHIRRRHLSEAWCIVPSNQVLVAANGVCATLYKRCVHAKVESRILAHLRDTLLPKLISGELRIPEAEKVVAAAT